MGAVFFTLLRMNLSASALITAVVLLRLLLRKAPKWTRCLLWAMVAVRLVCPVLPQSHLSLQPEMAEEDYTLADAPITFPANRVLIILVASLDFSKSLRPLNCS